MSNRSQKSISRHHQTPISEEPIPISKESATPISGLPMKVVSPIRTSDKMTPTYLIPTLETQLTTNLDRTSPTMQTGTFVSWRNPLRPPSMISKESPSTLSRPSGTKIPQPLTIAVEYMTFKGSESLWPTALLKKPRCSRDSSGITTSLWRPVKIKLFWECLCVLWSSGKESWLWSRLLCLHKLKRLDCQKWCLRLDN